MVKYMLAKYCLTISSNCHNLEQNNVIKGLYPSIHHHKLGFSIINVSNSRQLTKMIFSVHPHSKVDLEEIDTLGHS